MPNPLADEARALSDLELGEAINEAYREMFNLQFQRGTRQLQNPMAIRAARRQIARLRTIYRERQQGEAGGVPLARPTAPAVPPPSEDAPAEEDASVAEAEAEPVEGDAEPTAAADPPAADTALPSEDASAEEGASAAEAEPAESDAEPTAAQTSKDE